MNVKGTDLTASVSHAPDQHRYEISLDSEPAGFTEYRTAPGEIDFLHTEINPAFGGHGLGGKLVRAALDDARERGLVVLPHCEFVRGFIGKHEEYLDLVPPGRRAEFGLSRLA